MSSNIPQRPKDDSDLTRYIKAYVSKRDSSHLSQSNVKKSLETQVLLGELENLLKNMDQADARVQRILAKLHELKTAIMLTAEKE